MSKPKTATINPNSYYENNIKPSQSDQNYYLIFNWELFKYQN